jgi:hypothetical protein
MASKLKWSNFHVTVNFNKKDPGLIVPMRAAVEAMVEAPYLWQWLKHYDGSSQLEFTRHTAPLVETVRLRAAFEEDGKTNHGLHVHIVIEIGHRTMVQISKYGLCEMFRQLVGENPNVHCRFVRGDGEDKDFILRYITKEVPTYKPTSQLNSRLKYALSNPANEQLEVESSP